ncbi:RDD family protein [Pseudolabrys sp. FHR47]|uniref:RDD family protein n=1 Tax=Pseudolabrys sp. FHR47 TaxID=2562284 RepID=UPI0010BF0D1E|nr:RDD family protein [Pseudolabrys sp. FHR47]
MTQPEVAPIKQASTARKVFAAILDFFFIFIVGGYVVARFTGGTTDGGFELQGMPAFALFGIVILYFIVFSRFLGGTLFQRLLGVR